MLSILVDVKTYIQELFNDKRPLQTILEEEEQGRKTMKR